MVEKEYYENRYAEEGAGEEEVLSRPAWAREMPYWTVSAALHIFLVLIIGGLIFSREITRPQTRTPLVAKTIAPPPKFDPKKKRDLKRVPQILCPPLIEKPFVKLTPQEITTEIPKGSDIHKISDTNLELDSAIIAL